MNTLNINVEQMYDSEARGARLLERAKLSHEHQRQVLIGTMQSLDFDVVKDVLMFQWPDHRPPPPSQVFGDKRQQNARSPKGDGKGKGKDQQRLQQQPKRAYVTETEQTPEGNDEQQEDAPEPTPEGEEDAPEAEEVDQDEVQGEDEPEDDDFTQQINEIMTVTARKLAGVMQARKFATPKKSIAERKRTTHCAVCGQQGHWQGDPECAASSKKTNKGSGKGGKSDEKSSTGSSGKNPKTVHFVSFRHSNSDHEDEVLDHHPSHQVFVSSHVGQQVLLADATKAAGFVILDTACQRMCVGQPWVDSHTEKLQVFGIQPFLRPLQESFEFGKGPLVKSEDAFCFPASFGGQLCLMAPCIVPASIPCLASQTWMTDVGTVLDLAERQVHFSALHVSVPLHMINGHIAIDVMEFKKFHEHVSFWKTSVHELRSKNDYDEYMPLLRSAQASVDQPRDILVTQYENRPSNTSAMASELEIVGQCGYELGSASPEIPSTASAFSNEFIGKGKGSREVQGKSTKDIGSPVRASSPEEIRKSTRVLRSMPGVSQEVEVERSPTRLGALRRSIGFITVATAFLHQCLGRIVADEPAGTTGIPHGVNSAAFDIGAFKSDSPFFDNIHECGSPQEPAASSTFIDRTLKGKSIPSASQHGGDRRVGPDRFTTESTRQPSGVFRPPGDRSGDSQRLRLGRMKRLANNMCRGPHHGVPDL